MKCVCVCVLSRWSSNLFYSLTLMMKALRTFETSMTVYQNVTFRWPCISLQFFANDQFDALFCIIYITYILFITPLYMFRGSQCSSSGDRIVFIHHLIWLVCVSDCLVCRSDSNRHTKQSLTKTNHTRWYINTIRSPDNEHYDARNM